MKSWMKKYLEKGEFGLLDQRGRSEEYIDQDRYVQQLKRENEVLKKCLKIWKRKVQFKSMRSSKKQ
jgi:transposase